MQATWSQIQDSLRDRIGPEDFEVWFSQVQAGFGSDGALRILVPNKFHLQWIEENHLDDLRAVLRGSGASSERVDLRVKRSDPTGSASPTPGRNGTPVTSAAPAAAPVRSQAPASRPPRAVPGLAPDKTFENFVVGACNQFAHAAAQAVADTPGDPQYNPLFIYGDTGLGKTHLMQAIGNTVRARNPSARVLYVTAEQFTNELIDSLRFHKQTEFRDKFRRQPDMLLLDDVQFIGGKDRTQEELFHTFEYLKERNKQIVFTADVLPREIAKFEPRLRTRCESGMLADTQPPDGETMLAILRQKSDELHIDIDDALASWIASRVRGSIRELEGVLNRLDAVSRLQLGGERPSVEFAREQLSGILPDAPAPLTADEIIQTVSRFFSLKASDLLGTRRHKQVVRPRHIAMYLVREHTDLSFPEIGREFGGKDHSSIQHAYKKISKLLEKEPDLRNTIETIERTLTR